MEKSDLFLGTVIGIAMATIGCYIFIEAFTPYHFMDGIARFRTERLLGKIITLGTILNVIIFFVLLRFNKDIMARGVILATILLTVFTLFI